MKDWRRVDAETGMWIEDVVMADPPVMEDGTPDPAYIAEPVPPDAGFYHPRRDLAAGVWVEGLTAEEIAERRQVEAATSVPTPEERLAALEGAMLEMILGGVLT